MMRRLMFVNPPEGGDPTGGAGTPVGADPQPAEQTFSQADVDRIVRERVQRERAKYADYDDLKAKAGTVTTAEERIAALEQRTALAELTALRAQIAGEFGISTKAGENGEASDADLFLTGADADSMRAQAQRLAARVPEPKPNHVPREGRTPTPGADDPMRAFARDLFDRAATD